MLHAVSVQAMSSILKTSGLKEGEELTVEDPKPKSQRVSLTVVV